MPLNTGDRVGSYEVSAKIGEGGMGEVYRVIAAGLFCFCGLQLALRAGRMTGRLRIVQLSDWHRPRSEDYRRVFGAT